MANMAPTQSNPGLPSLKHGPALKKNSSSCFQGLASPESPAPSSTSTCPQGWTPPDSPTTGWVMPQVTMEDLQNLFEVLQKVLYGLTAGDTGGGRVQQAPDMDRLRQLLLNLVHARGGSSAEAMDKPIDSSGITESGSASTKWPGSNPREDKQAMEPYDSLKQYATHVADCMPPRSPYVSHSLISASRDDLISFAKWAMGWNMSEDDIKQLVEGTKQVLSNEKPVKAHAAPSGNFQSPLGRKPLTEVSIDELKSVLANSVQEALSELVIWPSAPTATPTRPIAQSKQSLDVNQLNKLLEETGGMAPGQPGTTDLQPDEDVSSREELQLHKRVSSGICNVDQPMASSPDDPGAAKGAHPEGATKLSRHVELPAMSSNSYAATGLHLNPPLPHSGQSTPNTIDAALLDTKDVAESQSSGDTEVCSCIASTDPVTLGQLKELFEAVLARKSQLPEGPMNGPDATEESGKQDEVKRIRASKLEYKTVNEIWDEKAYNYKIVDSVPVSDVNEWDEWTFVVRKRVDRRSGEVVTFIDIKSPALRGILRRVLKKVRTASLEADKPAVERNLLYHFLPELKDRARPDTEQHDHSDEGISHLELLVQHLEGAYCSITEQLPSLLAHRKITYDLLWAWFKPGTLAYVKCPSTGLPRCIQYSFGAESQTDRKVDCFEIHGHCFDFDGEVFGETTETIQIEVFRGAIRIENLPVYPLEYHPDPAIRSCLISNGRKFISLMACHHRQYEGNMFVLNNNGKLVKFHVDSRIMVDVRLFRKTIPNYPRFEIKKPQVFDMFGGNVLESTSVDRIRGTSIDPSEMDDDDIARCSPTLLGFSLNEKIWGEFSVENIHEVKFSSSPFDMLAIPEAHKKVVRSLTEARVRATHEARNDDVIVGKGQGVNILLHGSPGVGKTLTAEAIAEYFQRPLYSISSGQLSSEAEELEIQLGRIFDAAATWKAVLLLDEADVYLQRRDSLQLQRNRLVATFLRTLEYYGGIFFLTTNLLHDFDEAILDRIQLKLRYDDLDPLARRSIFNHHFQEANADIEEKDLSTFAEIKLNGRQIKNIVKLAVNVALSDGDKLSASHVRIALTANQYSLPFQESLGFDDSLYEA